MKKFGKEGTQRLKAFHIIFTLMWMGGVATLIAMQQLGSPSSPDMYPMTTNDQLMVDRAMIIPADAGLGKEDADDLRQVLGHGSWRFYAAMGSPSGLGLVRSKNVSMALAGTW